MDEEVKSAEQAESKSGKIKKEFWEWFKALAIALVAALFVTQVLIVNAKIPSESMEKTIMTGDHVLGNRLAFLFSVPKRGDIVIFKYPDNEKVLFVKRIIGMPGDIVEVRNGKVYINDAEKPLMEEYINGTPTGDFGPYTVPEDSYFMMGDNRDFSLDSRYWENKFVKRDKIIAEAVFRFFPNPGWLE